MKKTLIALAAAAIPAVMSAQSAPDAYSFSQSDIRGTARFMSMGGAFTALGGDLSTLSQNPAGLGVYRRSEIGATLDISPRRVTATTPSDKISTDATKVFCNNFGYVGVANLGGPLRTFAWGVSYNRIGSFNREFTSYDGAAPSSLTNYIASYTNNSGVAPSTLTFVKDKYNPYQQSDADWLSILAYNSLLINDVNGRYYGLGQDGTVSDAQSVVRQSGYVDEYNIDFGGNVSEVVMWGLGVGITDLSFNSTVAYSESMAGAYIPSADNRMTTGSAEYDLVNYRNVSGTGVNLKFGLIFRPINEFRLGVAVHTPTWYTMSSNQTATVYSDFMPDNMTGDVHVDNEYTDDAYYNFKMNAPWKFMIGAAGVIGNQAIVSLDYERQAFGDISVKYQDGWGNYVSDPDVNQDVKNYYKAANIIRLGVEYRLTPRLSARAGYNFSTATSKQEVLDGRRQVFTAGTDPAFTLNKTSNAISVGLGYRWSSFYLDAAYVWRRRNSEYCAFTSYDGIQAPKASLAETTNDIVFSLGFKF
ncbi:MAG: hypothetical protein K2M19_05040 [Muribaculaceae bacterium]|nr:hypothetical protein [Muribaculaceae bacterium]